MTSRFPAASVAPKPGGTAPGGTVVPLHKPAGAAPSLSGAPGAGLGPEPHTLLAERVVIAEALVTPVSLATTSWLKPEFFYAPRNAQAWEAILALAAGGTPGDLGDVALWLQTHKGWKGADGLKYLSNIADGEAYTNDVGVHANRIHDLWRLRELIRAARAIAIEGLDRAEDPDAAIREAEGAIRAVVETAREREQGSSLAEVARARIEQLKALAAGEDTSGGRVSTGFRALDRSTGGYGPGELWILGGITGTGKTALSLGLAANVAFGQDLGVAVFSFEMQKHELAERLLSAESGVPAAVIKEGHLREDEVLALEETEFRFRRLSVLLDDDGDLTVFDLAQRAQAYADRLKGQGKRLALVVVDYLQIVRERGVKGRTREQEVAEISGELKRLAKRLNCTVLALSQLNGEFEKESRPPRSGDLRESKKIAQDADLVGILWRSKETPRGAIDLRITKQRKGKAAIDVTLGWRPEHTRFCDFERGHGGMG